MRLENFVSRLPDLDIEEAVQLDSRSDSDSPFERSQERFNETLQQAIRQLRLSQERTTGKITKASVPLPAKDRTGEH